MTSRRTRLRSGRRDAPTRVTEWIWRQAPQLATHLPPGWQRRALQPVKTHPGLAAPPDPFSDVLPHLSISGIRGPGERGVTHIVSIDEPGVKPPAWVRSMQENGVQVLALPFSDVWEGQAGFEVYRMPDSLLEQATALGKQLTPEHWLHVHCHAGISRSTAIALHILASTPEAYLCSDLDLGRRVFDARPKARPNPHVLARSDAATGRQQSQLWSHTRPELNRRR